MNLKNLALGIGIIVVFALTLGYGIEAFYSTPDYEDYCGKIIVPQTLNEDGSLAAVTKVQCEATEWAEWKGYDSPRPVALEGKMVSETGYCDYYATCQKEYENALDKYSWIVFVISIIVGIIALVVGYTILSIEPVGSALMGSGIWSFFYGGVINWRNFGELWRFVILAVILVILIWATISLNRKEKMESGLKRWFKGFGFGKK